MFEQAYKPLQTGWWHCMGTHKLPRHLMTAELYLYCRGTCNHILLSWPKPLRCSSSIPVTSTVGEMADWMKPPVNARAIGIPKSLQAQLSLLAYVAMVKPRSMARPHKLSRWLSDLTQFVLPSYTEASSSILPSPKLSLAWLLYPQSWSCQRPHAIRQAKPGQHY